MCIRDSPRGLHASERSSRAAFQAIAHLGLPRLGDVQQKYVPQNMIKKWRERFNMTIENTGAGRGSIFVPSLG